jgi:hypothetical protein
VVERDLKAGRKAYFSGKVERFNYKVQLANPEYQLVDDEAGVVREEFAGALVPIYPGRGQGRAPDDRPQRAHGARHGRSRRHPLGAARAGARGVSARR